MVLRLFADSFVSIGAEAEDDLSDSLRCVGKGCVDDAQFHRKSIYYREGKADDEMEGTDTAWYWYSKTESSDKRQEESINHVKFFEEWSCPHCT